MGGPSPFPLAHHQPLFFEAPTNFYMRCSLCPSTQVS
ncbi:hypothetical protein BVRB_6g149280 [Beta vulgaris subsp. vulgaris]|nr:hypothetical protein BVRB_6g149280 [Beta vulgaris subsp. vulgaris]